MAKENGFDGEIEFSDDTAFKKKGVNAGATADGHLLIVFGAEIVDQFLRGEGGGLEVGSGFYFVGISGVDKVESVCKGTADGGVGFSAKDADTGFFGAIHEKVSIFSTSPRDRGMF